MNLLSKQHAWEFLVKPFKDEKIAITSSTSGSSIADVTNKQTDIFDVTSTIDDKKEAVKYQPNSTELPSDNPFAGW
jgi:hypothetical protein